MRNIDVPTWSNDGKKVYHSGRPVRGADPKTFEVLLGRYARDVRSVFFSGTRATKIDRATFRVLNANFGVDFSGAYFVVTLIRDADPRTFRVLDSSLATGPLGCFLQAGYAADRKSVWFASGNGIYRINTADAKSFVSLGNRFGMDRDRVYYEHSMLPKADRTTWRHWRGLLSADKDSIFFTNKRVQGVDRTSIWLLAADDCFADRRQIYCGAKPVTRGYYLEHRLKYREDACAFEREWIPTGRLLERIRDEFPHEV